MPDVNRLFLNPQEKMNDQQDLHNVLLFGCIGMIVVALVVVVVLYFIIKKKKK